MYNFGGFSERANSALNLAIETAGKFGHTYVGSEHLLIGILKERENTAAQLLLLRDVTAEKIEERVADVIGRGYPTKLSPTQFTPRVKRILDTAVKIAKSNGEDAVGTEHILNAILKESDNYAVRFIKEFTDDVTPLQNDIDKLDGQAWHQSDKPHEIKAKAKNQPSSTKELDKFSRDLTAEAKEGKIDPVIGRAKEIERVIQILTRRTKNNPCLIGEPGVGKTAVIEGLALKIVNGEVPEILLDKRIVSLDLTGMVAGTKYRGEFEERISNAINEVKKAGDVILFIDEIHNIVGAGSSEGSNDAANILKPQLARGDLQLIGATTLNEYRLYIEKDAALERRFQPINVGEPTEGDSIEILEGLRDRYEAHHKVKITDSAIEAAVKLSSRYISDRFLPDKAIDLIDEACSKVRLSGMTPPADIKEMEETVKRLDAEKTAAINAQDFEKAAMLRDEQAEMTEAINELRKSWRRENEKYSGEINSEHIAEIVSDWTGVPVVQLTEEESDRLMRLEAELHNRVIGQDEAVTAVAKAIRRGRVGLKDPKRPIGSFLFSGPTGVGKTELCRALAEAMFGDENAMIKLDMSEYMEKHTVSRLVGSPPGYVGYEEGGQLTEKVRRKPYCVVLFDEIEKAHPDVFNMLLQILEDGVLTDSQGRKVNFKNTVVILTSNVGAKMITEKKASVGFGSSENENADIKSLVTNELKQAFRPEFLNRIDDIIVFTKLDAEQIKQIAEKMLENLSKRVASLGMSISFTDEAISAIAKAGFDTVYGARPLRRAIQNKIEDALSEYMLESKFISGDKIVCDFANNEFSFNKE